MKKIIKIIIAFILIIFIFSIFDIYFFKNKTFVGKFFTNVLPYPAIFIDNSFVSIKEYNKIANVYKKYIYDTSSIKTEFLNDIVARNLILKKLSKKFNINISNSEIESFSDEFFTENDIQKDKVDAEEIKEYIIKPILFEQKISKKLREDEFNIENKKKIENIYSNLAKDPTLFDEYAKSFRDTNLAFDGGILGWLPKKDLPDDLQEQIDNMEINKFTIIMKSLSGYHIYKLVGKLIDEKNGEIYYQIEQIYFPIMDFDNYYKNFIKSNKVYYFFK